MLTAPHSIINESSLNFYFQIDAKKTYSQIQDNVGFLEVVHTCKKLLDVQVKRVEETERYLQQYGYVPIKPQPQTNTGKFLVFFVCFFCLFLFL